jgi:hypothetical protein
MSHGTLYAILIDPEVYINHLEVHASCGDATQSKTKININDTHQLCL